MPRGDRTGPGGFGPMTGRVAGYCAGYGVPGYANPAVGRGAGVVGGHGWRHMYYATGLPGWLRWGCRHLGFGLAAPYTTPYGARYTEPDPDSEKQVLQNQVTFLETTLERLKKRLADLEQGACEKSS
ncbi:MAG: DUF5320 domain-containing protein [Thermoleophilia bacterium]|nr:DUF5320 domain-containing protein [Thermoleophilia bacterium]